MSYVYLWLKQDFLSIHIQEKRTASPSNHKREIDLKSTAVSLDIWPTESNHHFCYQHTMTFAVIGESRG